MRTVLIAWVISLVCIIYFTGYRLKVLQNQVSCLQDQVEREQCQARYNVRIFNYNKRVNDRKIEAINENFKHIVKYLKMGY